MNISKNKKTITSKFAGQINKHSHDNLFISSNLDINQMKKFLTVSNINVTDNKGETVLSYAIKRNRTDLINYLLGFDEINLNYYDKTGKGYLHKATIDKNYDVMALLINKGINVNSTDCFGNSPLHYATIANDPMAIKILVSSGGNISMKNNSGETPMSITKRNGNLRCINVLYKRRTLTNLELDLDINTTKDNSISRHERNHSAGIFNTNISSLNATTDNGTAFLSNGHSKKMSIDDISLNRSLDLNEEEKEKNKEKFQLVVHVGSPKNFSLKGSGSNNNNNSKDILHPNLNFEKFLNETDGKVHTKTSNNEDSFNIIDSKLEDSYNLSSTQSVKLNLTQRNEDVPLKAEKFYDNNEIILTVQSRKNDIILKVSESQKLSGKLDKKKVEMKGQKKELKLLYENETNHNKEAPDDKIYSFLSEIYLEKYASNMVSIGFDDIDLMISEAQRGIGITYRNLKEAGVELPGEIARILVHIEDMSELFPFRSFNKIKVFFPGDKEEKIYEKEMEMWLKEIKMEKYKDNFINNGFYSLDLLLITMLTKQPINESILEHCGIDKIGYKARIINKLKEDSRKFSLEMIKKYGKNQKSSKIYDLKCERMDSGNPCECTIF